MNTRQMVWNMPGERLKPAPQLKGPWRIGRAIDGRSFTRVATFYDEAYARRMFARVCAASRSGAVCLVDPMGAVRDQLTTPAAAQAPIERLR